MATIKITLTRGTNRSKEKQVATIQALGLSKIGSVVEKTDNPATRGMIRKVAHLVTVEEN
ncbi:MAG: 50S ribosomal protein L30 [Bacillota bacterium]